MHRTPDLQWPARIGYAARGIVFLILAYFAALSAWSAHVRPRDSKDALEALLLQPAGSVLLCLLTIGLLCFAVWRGAQCVLDADGCGSGLYGLARRFIYGAAGVFYACFACVAVAMMAGSAAGGTEKAVHDWTGWLLLQPMGQWLTACVGVAVLASGIGIGITGLRAEFRQRIALKEKPRWLVTLLGSAGYLARGAVFCVIGLFLIFAALDTNAHEAAGFAGALQIIQRQPAGPLLLGLTAAGLFAFGAYGLAEALFRRINGKTLPVAQTA